MENEMISWMRDLVDAYDHREQSMGPVEKENRMWRNKFLNSLEKKKDPKKAAIVWNTFMAIPSSDFMGSHLEDGIFLPEKLINHIEMGVENET